MAKVHLRTLEIVQQTFNGAQNMKVTALNYYRTESELAAANPFVLAATTTEAGAALGTVAVSPYDVFLGELLPPPSRIRLTTTISA